MNTESNRSETKPSTPTVVIYSNAARFALGQIVATPGAIRLLEKTGFSAAALINRHVHGDWGDCCNEDAKQNEFAVANGERVFSVYRLVDAARLSATPVSKRSDLPTLWTITDFDRSVTTLLLPSEY